ncbi:hypothetical protein [Acidomonas methanolica]|uniref:Phage protein n=1 Tax=Acidomonas methanolica NBRC 104435 TaxID=1231351 RepID=A0A023D503_ACIMT|nr:hypothetical protein [Acidomonas methanolica]MBU2654256.1 hypothetical protein [Acidomonas methanolica]MCQ9154076.1 hypothetical protein [Acidomonas methanolica]TCS29306.1 hypothetical protein EDC31_10778 [Acidomonas methanolica]GAJ29197.1 phage protein [Acidomonas methanolica NBRC 104435]GBQ51003.1 hypothetical protein AA0498_1351 [Acidomonas methanolica]
MANPYSIGRNCRVTLLWNGSRVDMRDVTSFQASQVTRAQRADPLNSVPVVFNTPGGWRGSFGVVRADATLDSLVAAVEAAFWNGGILGSGTIYQYISEPDGSQTTWEYTNVTMTLETDRWAAEEMMHYTVQFFASTRVKIS